MPEKLIKKIRTIEGDLQIDYNALANLPDLSDVGAQADWAETDETAKSFVKNKPFYEDADGTVHKLDPKFIDIPEDVVAKDELAEVAFSGSYNDLTDVPEQVQSDWNQTDATQPDYIKNKPTLTGTKTATELPSDNILQANTMYFIGEATALSIGFPTTATIGDMVYISFFTGETIPTFTFTTNNHAGLDTINKLKNYKYELIGMWNGQEWMFAIHEVEA